MGAGGGNLQGARDVLLAFHANQILDVDRLFLEQGVLPGGFAPIPRRPTPPQVA